jgi:hypothetical protein
MGEGWGEGEKSISTHYPLPFIPSHKGRGIGTFYEFFNLCMPYLLPVVS